MKTTTKEDRGRRRMSILKVLRFSRSFVSFIIRNAARACFSSAVTDSKQKRMPWDARSINNHLLILDGDLKLWYSVCCVWKYGRINILLEKHFHLRGFFFAPFFAPRIFFPLLEFYFPFSAYPWRYPFARALNVTLGGTLHNIEHKLSLKYLFRELMSDFFTSWSSLFEIWLLSAVNACLSSVCWVFRFSVRSSLSVDVDKGSRFKPNSLNFFQNSLFKLQIISWYLNGNWNLDPKWLHRPASACECRDPRCPWAWSCAVRELTCI